MNERPAQPAPTRPRTPPVRRPGSALYSELTRDLRDRIDRGEFPPGARLPSENELAQTYGVNRLTVRRALSELAQTNAIRTEHGVGSFVREPSVRHRVDDGHAGLAESMAARGLTVTHELVSAETLTRDDLDEDTRSRIPDGWRGPLTRFRFRRLLEGIPWSLSTAVMPADLVPAGGWDATGSLPALLADHGTPVVRAERGFSAAPAGDEDARWLDVAPGTPVLVIKGLNTDQDGDPVMFLHHHTRADRAEYVIQPSRKR
ncbi:GntR family transcriptional regulator [Nonomuraea sp. NPDC005650]|uniref:GntR family transcriptional regulator n=1 Tax=Nonomuraea sp. NPDC005650 TaxID=3157045 RepID=UPI0033B52932